MSFWQVEDLTVLVVTVVAIIVLILLIFPSNKQTSRRPWPRFRAYSNRRQDRPASSNPAQPSYPPPQPVPLQDFVFGADQLNAVIAGAFQKRRLMNRGEYRVFCIVEDAIGGRGGHRVFAQTCLGEVLQSADKSAFLAINAKRVDILVVDGSGWPVLAIEYQGQGHYQGTAAVRDAIKKEALRKAGVRTMEVVPTDGDELIRRRVHEMLGWSPPELVAAPAIPRVMASPQG